MGSRSAAVSPRVWGAGGDRGLRLSAAASGVPPEVPALRSGPRSAHLGGVVRVVVDQHGAGPDVPRDEQDAAEDEGDGAPPAGGAEQLVAGAGILAVHGILRGFPTDGVDCSGGASPGLAK